MLRSVTNKSLSSVNALQNNFLKLRITQNVTQIREKNILNRPRLRNPFWFVRKERTVHNDLISPENSNFVKEVLHDKFGPPALIKGVPSYKNACSSLIKVDEQPKVEWEFGNRRTGVIARKIGQYPLWKKDGTKIRTTLLQIVDNHVIRYFAPGEFEPTQTPNVHNLNKFGCLLVGAESTDPTMLTKDYCGLFKDSGVMPKKVLSRFIVSPTAALLPGTPLNVTHFRPGDYVDVRGKTVDRGFQGVIVRHGFKGMPASHGVTKTHRRGGCIGGGGEKGRVWPGTKMPGHMGNRYRIARGLKIWRINTKYNVMWVTGSGIPGDTNGIVYVYDTMLPLRKYKTAPPYPTAFTEELSVEGEDVWVDDVHNFKDPTIHYAAE